MKLLGNILAFIVVTGILVAIGWGGYIGIQFLVNQYEIINPQLAAILIISSVIILISALIIAGAIRRLDKGSDKQVHPEKAVLYSRFIENWYNTRDGNYEDIKEQEKHMLLWASDEVLDEYLKLNKCIEGQKGIQPLEEQVKNMIIAIRQDLGAENKNIDSDRLQALLSLSSPS